MAVSVWPLSKMFSSQIFVPVFGSMLVKPSLSFGRRTLRAKQIEWFDAERVGDPFEHIDRRRIVAAFQTAYIGSVHIRPVGELFL